MLSSPYPVPNLRAWQVVMAVGALAGVAAGTWVVVSPPKSYDQIGLALTIAWGVMLAIGSGVALIGQLTRKYKVELPGLVLALGGVAIYDYLSWQQTLGDSLGSGPRALLLITLACFILARIIMLIFIDREARRRIEASDPG